MSGPELIEQLRTLLSEVDDGLSPGRLYTAAEIAERWGCAKARVYEIHKSELPRVRTGPKGGNARFRGIDVLRYEAGLKPIEPDLDRFQVRGPSRIVSLRHRNERTRIA